MGIGVSVSARQSHTQRERDREPRQLINQSGSGEAQKGIVAVDGVRRLLLVAERSATARNRVLVSASLHQYRLPESAEYRRTSRRGGKRKRRRLLHGFRRAWHCETDPELSIMRFIGHNVAVVLRRRRRRFKRIISQRIAARTRLGQFERNYPLASLLSFVPISFASDHGRRGSR